MQKRTRSQLAVYQIEKDADILPVGCLKELYLKKTSEIVYIVRGTRLYGIICLGDVLNKYTGGRVKINRHFTSLKSFNIIKAHEIFLTKRNIHKIPIVNEQGILLGDYSRWDDEFYFERNYSLLMKARYVKALLDKYENVYVVEPVNKRDEYYLCFVEYLQRIQIRYEIMYKEQIVETIKDNNIYMFSNEDEKRGTQCLIRMMFGQDGDIINVELIGKFFTYHDLLEQIMWQVKFEQLGIEKPDNVLYNRIDDRATVFLGELEKKGVKCFCLYCDANETTEYRKTLINEINKRMEMYPFYNEKPWPQKIHNKEFYGELYEEEDYELEVAQKEMMEATRRFEVEQSVSGKYFNATDGRRKTCFQPEKYEGTIYLLGPCIIIGTRVEDQYTIGSYLQDSLNRLGYAYRVENYGSLLFRFKLEKRLEEINYCVNDIVIYLSTIGEAIGIQGISVEEIFGKYQVPGKWFYNDILHCNHKGNKVIVQYIQELIEFYWLDNVLEKNKHKNNIHVDFNNVMKYYVKRKYIDLFFEKFMTMNYDTVGAIVMNGNPFSKGHRYLIEQAISHVKFLIIFVVEEDESLFPFEERFHMIVEGTKDLDNIMVVPSGEFILSKSTFGEYFTKVEDKFVFFNAEYDINVFAEYIAKPLCITYRFAGEEPTDRVTGIYNKVMKMILPRKDITFVEIPRLTIGGEQISASKVRSYLEEENYEKAFALLPETTIQYLQQMKN